MHLVDLETEPDYKVLADIQRNPANNQYILFTRQNPENGQSLVMNDAESIRNSFYNPRVPTVVVTHGWLSGQNTNINPTIRDAYLETSDVNVIILDWRRLAISNYVTAVRGVPGVGRGLGQFIKFLIETTGADINEFHLIGFSLGAHVVGNAGRELEGKVARITGLDPGGLLWNDNDERLDPTDGVYVEAIYTARNATGLRIGVVVGDAEFFPNGGFSQPGCSNPLCNHNRAYELFSSTIKRNHLVGNLCESYLELTLNACHGRPMHMGNDDLRKTGYGMYRLNTGERYPF
ncbi:unnamed protein product [Diatraea saccharalis]|uniref:Lipase domain-containing protein n=1 Tax=Diatraea saccharalis TaxID=40085 RepID=A0A9P0G323_9NEOP|nr:unnamed protein product [Diatraea saccharalis]